MVAFAELQRCAFGGTEFFVEEMEIKGGLRNHTHEYPHVPGGNNELLGRQLYRISIKARFGAGSAEYPDQAVSERLATLRELFEQGVVEDLILPTIGTIQAHALEWSQTLEQNHGNGERAMFEFIEDSLDATVTQTAKSNSTNVVDKFDTLMLAVDDSGFDVSFFDALKALVEQLAAYRDQVDLYAELIATKAEQIADMIRTLNEAIELDGAEFYAVVEAMQDVGVAADQLAKDALSQVAPLAYFETPIEMTIAEIGVRIYGDTSHNVDLLKLNAIDDAFAVPANTTIVYYAFPTPVGALAA
jgi:prophage DNA circulation protein